MRLAHSPMSSTTSRSRRTLKSVFASSHFAVSEWPCCGGEHPESIAYTVTDNSLIQADIIPIWLRVVLEQLRVIAALPDNWDSYGASAPDVDRLEAAWNLLICLCQNTDLPQPHVNPTPNGGVQFEWEVGSRYFEIEVEAVTAATYLYSDSLANVEETGCIFQDDDLLEPIRDYVRKVNALS